MQNVVDTKLSIRGEKLIQGFEGFCLKFYGDSKGYPTVGYGHLITSKEKYKVNTTGNPNDSLLTAAQVSSLVKKYKLKYTSPITQNKADELFEKDVAWAVQTVNDIKLPSGCVFSQAQFDAMVSIVFNSGGKILKTNDMIAMLNMRNVFAWNGLTSSQCDTCSKMVSKAFSYDKSMKPRRNKEAELFCEQKPYTHKYKVYTL